MRKIILLLLVPVLFFSCDRFGNKETYADNLFFFKEGELVMHGKPKDVLTENMIEQVLNIRTTVIENPVTSKPLVIYS